MKEAPKQVVEKWLGGLSRKSRGDIAGGLILLEHMREKFSLSINDYKASQSDQLKGATPSAVAEILKRHGEKRLLSKEAGRTNRGLMKNLALLLKLLVDSGISTISAPKQKEFLGEMQRILVDKASAVLDGKKLCFRRAGGMTSRMAVAGIMEQAKSRGKHGDVAEYLVGAKLALRFPDIQVRNTSANAADDQSGEHGDFRINESVFHVTVSPNHGHYEKCAENLKNNLRVFMLVSDDVLHGTRQNVEGNEEIRGRVAVESIESFVSQNIEELSVFSEDDVADKFCALIDTYNNRVQEVETNLSLLIEIPVRIPRRKQ